MNADIKKVLFAIVFGFGIFQIGIKGTEIYFNYNMGKIMRNPGISDGVVYAKGYVKGRSIKVSFVVDGKVYYTSKGASIEEYASFNIGDHLTVKYEKGNPGNSIIIW